MNVNEELADELHKLATKKIKKKKTLCEILRQYLSRRFSLNEVIVF